MNASSEGLDKRRTEGRVEYCLNSKWGTVCGNTFSHTDAEVVCANLGYPAGAG